MNRWLHYPAALLCALLISYGLFYFMQYLTSHRETAFVKRQHNPPIEFIQLKKAEPQSLKPVVKLEVPTPRNTPPPTIAPENMPTTKPRLNIARLGMPKLTHLDIQSIDFSMSPSNGDGDAVPIFRVNPQHPFRATQQGIEGWVRVEFTITTLGTVKDAKVIESKPAYLFDHAAIRAVKRWRFKPRIVDGRPVEREVIQLIDFSLDDDK